jgi:hypothetical protein
MKDHDHEDNSRCLDFVDNVLPYISTEALKDLTVAVLQERLDRGTLTNPEPQDKFLARAGQVGHEVADWYTARTPF